ELLKHTSAVASRYFDRSVRHGLSRSASRNFAHYTSPIKINSVNSVPGSLSLALVFPGFLTGPAETHVLISAHVRACLSSGRIESPNITARSNRIAVIGSTFTGVHGLMSGINLMARRSAADQSAAGYAGEPASVAPARLSVGEAAAYTGVSVSYLNKTR